MVLEDLVKCLAFKSLLLTSVSIFDQRLLWWYLPLSLAYNVSSYDVSGKDFLYKTYQPHPTNHIRV